MGGAPPEGPGSTTTEEYDGTSWSAGGALATARYINAGTGTQSAGLCMGGYGGGALNSTEEYDPGPGTYAELFSALGGL
jgi:hypothetical protein